MHSLIRTVFTCLHVGWQIGRQLCCGSVWQQAVTFMPILICFIPTSGTHSAYKKLKQSPPNWGKTKVKLKHTVQRAVRSLLLLTPCYFRKFTKHVDQAHPRAA